MFGSVFPFNISVSPSKKCVSATFDKQHLDLNGNEKLHLVGFNLFTQAEIYFVKITVYLKQSVQLILREGQKKSISFTDFCCE